jgi:hypothetical protein
MSGSRARCKGVDAVGRGLAVRPGRQRSASRSIPTNTAPERSVLLAVDQQPGEGTTLRVSPELADPVGSLEVGEHQGVE